MATKTAKQISAPAKPKPATPVGNAKTVQRKAGTETVIAGGIQRKESTGNWLFQKPQHAVTAQNLVQPKIKIHPSNDSFEKEADRVADSVVSAPSPAPASISKVSSGLQKKSYSGSIQGLKQFPVQRKISSASRSISIQRKQSTSNNSSLQGSDSSPPSSQTTTHPLQSVLSGQNTRGSPLPTGTRSFMESRIGADFSNVRIHTGQESNAASTSIGARAFTHGPNIHFSSGEYDPHSSKGQHLLAHELTHTVQQGASPTSIQRKSDHSSSSISPENIYRGPPVQAKAEAGIIQCAIYDNALARIGELLSDIPITLDVNVAKNWLKRKMRQFASYIPGYTAVGVVLGFDPITGDHVERNGRNFIEAALDIIPFGSLLKQKLEELGAIERAATWIDQQLETLSSIISNVRDEFLTAWNHLGIGSIIDGPIDTLENFGRIFERAINNLITFAERAARELLDIVKKFLLTQLVNFIKNHTNAYELLKVILGKDPITDEVVTRNGTNILNALLELGGEQGREQRRQMQDTGTFQKAADWIDRGIAVFGDLYQTIRDNFGLIWDAVSIQSLMDPVGTFNRIYETFAAPVRRVLDFVEEALRAILALIKEVLMQRLSAWARTVRGYQLVTVLIGKDPFTDRVVPRTIPNVIRGFMSLMEGGEEQYRQMEESGAIARTTQRINAAVARLNMTPASIVQLFIDLWNSFSFNDLAHPIEAFQRIIEKFGEPIGRLIAFVVEIVKIVVHVILELMNFPFDLINNIITRAMQAFERIKRDPIGFLKNLLRAIKQGFSQFFNNIVTHLINGVVGWLMSELRDANVPQPTDFSLRGIISWVLQVLGISMEAIWQKLAAHPRIGPERVARIRGMIDRLEGVWTFIRDVQQRGVAAIWDKIQEQLTNLWNTVLDAIKNWIMDRIISQVTARLLSMLDPTGIMAVINSAIAIYRAIQSFIRYLRQMLEVVNSFVNGVADIAEGNVTTAANYLERTMDRAMPIVIGFLANQIGLSGVGRRIAEIIASVRQMVDGALTWLVNRAVDTGFAMFDRLMSMGRSAVDAVRSGLGRLLGIRQSFNMGGQSHSLFFRQSGSGVELMMASEPQAVRTFLSTQATANASNPTQLQKVRTAQSQLTAVERAYNDIVSIQARGANQDASVQQYAELNTAIGVLVNYLSQLGTALAPTGKNNNALDAIEMRWMKVGYPGSVELTATGQRIFMNQPERVEIPDIPRLQNLRNEGFSDRRIRIGVSSGSIFWPAVGKVWPRVQSGAIRTGTVQDQFRRLLTALGYTWGTREADHVRDLQWGGQDDYSNLWPLERANNIAANQILNQPVTYQDDSGNIQTGVPLHTTPLNRYFRITAIQAKLKLNTGNDDHEKEADHVADKVTGSEKNSSPVSITRLNGSIQRKSDGPNGGYNPGSKVASLLSDQSTRGSPLPVQTKSYMENRMGADFSSVRIHTNNDSHEANSSIGSKAFTHGSNIYFASGQYNPGTKDGQHLLAHELTHTVQQGASSTSIQRKTEAGSTQTSKPNKSGGNNLSDDAREYFEDHFKTSLAHVKIHIDSESTTLCRTLGVRSFSEDDHIFIDRGSYNPESENGVLLLAQEVAKVVRPGKDGGAFSIIDIMRSALKQIATQQPVKKQAKNGTIKPATKEKDKKGKGGKKQGSKSSSHKHREGELHGEEMDSIAADKTGKKKSPSKPEEDPAFLRTIKKAKARAKQQQTHDKPEAKADDAQKAALAVPNEAQSKAQNRKTGEMGEAGSKDVPFDVASFKADMMKKIEEITPKNLDEANDFKEDNKVGEVKSVMGVKVSSEKKKTTGPVDEATAEPLHVNEADNKQPVTLPPTDKGPKPASIGAKDAAPKKKTEDEISMQQQSVSLDEEMKQNNVSEDQLQGSNEPSFQQAVKEKKGAQKDAVEKPALFRKEEGPALKGAETEATGKAAMSLAGMHATRGKNFDAVVKQQSASKTKDEERRAEVAKNINDKYSAAEKKVNELLGQAETMSNELFDKGSEAARQLFEDYVDQRMRAYKRRRYSGMFGGLRWAKDKLFGMPGEVNEFYSKGRDIYLSKMDDVITGVAKTVTEKLNGAKKAIEDGKKAVDDYVAQLPKDLKDVGKEAAENIHDKFDSLEQSVNDKRNQLIDGLSRKYVDNVKKLDDRIHELKEANKGLIAKAIGLLKEVWKVIKNLYSLFKTILSKLAQIIGIIIGAPGKFFDNLGAAFKKGFDMFVSRLDEHLENGLMIWLSSQLGVADLKLPEKFDIASIFGMVLQVMGISYEHIRERAVLQIGEERVGMMETAAGVFQRIYREGLGAVWEIIKEKFTDFKDMIWEAIKTFIRDAVIKAAIMFLLSLLNPIAAFVKACMAIYDFLMMLVRMKDKIIDLLNSILDAVMTIATGSVDAAAGAIEKAFAKSIPIIIGFLAALLHLNNIGSKVRDIILRIRAKVDKLIDWLIGKCYSLVRPAVDAAMRMKNKGKEMIEKGKQKAMDVGRSAVHSVAGWLGLKKHFKLPNGESHEMYFSGSDANPTLMVASADPKSIEELVRARRQMALQPHQNKSLSAALDKKRKLLEYISNNSATNATGGASTTNLQAAINDQLDLIKQDLIDGDALPMATTLPLSNITYSMDGSKAKTVIARPLTKLPGNTKGSRPPGGNPNIPLGWQHVLSFDGPHPTNWVRAHLINEDLHGPGQQWNLVPGSQQLNAQMRDGSEKWAKDEIAKDDIVHYKSDITGWHNINANPLAADYFPQTISVTYGYMANSAKGRTAETTRTDHYSQTQPPATATTTPGMPSINSMSRQAIRTMFAGVANVDLIFDTRNSLPNKSFRDLAHMYFRLRDAYNNNPEFEATYWPLISQKFNFDKSFQF